MTIENLNEKESMMWKLLILERDITRDKLNLENNLKEYNTLSKAIFNCVREDRAVDEMDLNVTFISTHIPNKQATQKVDLEICPKRNPLDIKTSLYVLTFNSPDQIKSIFKSFEEYDSNFLDVPKKYLIDNSTNLGTTDEYKQICDEYGFEHIKKDNLGICGARQFVAEHFDATDSEYYIFFEDDMHLYNKISKCKNGKNRYVKDLYEKTISIMDEEGYDYLKLSYTEFFGDCGTQWAWYNVPQHIREKFFPDKSELPREGLDAHPPKTEIFYEKHFKDLEYLEGEFHYCNWPIWFSKKGNKKVFLDVTWGNPFEQTWMSQTFQYQKVNEIKCAVLNLTPINHDRFNFYDYSERKEC